MRTWIKPIVMGFIGVLIAGGMAYGAWIGWTAYKQHQLLWTWANAVAPRINSMESKLTGFKPGDPLPPGAFYEDGEKYGFPKGTKVTVMPPQGGAERKPGKK